MYRHFTGVYYSEIVKRMADDRGAHWLIDAIASHRLNKDLKERREHDERFHDMEIWVLTPNGDGGATLKAVADTTPAELDKTKIVQEIPFTDFDFKGEQDYKLYCGYTMVPDGKGGSKAGFYIYHPSEY